MEIPRHWRLKKQRYGLIGQVCPDTENKIFPPVELCPHCGERGHEQFHFSGKGEVYSYTTVVDAPQGYQELVPYVVALVMLDEGPILTAMLTDIDLTSLAIGMPVEMVTRKLRDDGDERGFIIYGYKFRPVMSE